METMLDGYLPGVRCPNCYFALPRTVAELRVNPEVTCPSCGTYASIPIATDMRSLDEALATVLTEAEDREAVCV